MGGFPREDVSGGKGQLKYERLIEQLNSSLKVYGEIRGVNYQKAAKLLSIPTLKSKCTSKQLSGYISKVALAINSLNKEKKNA